MASTTTAPPAGADAQPPSTDAAGATPLPKAESVDLKQVVPAAEPPAPAPIIGPQPDAGTTAAAPDPLNASLTLLGTEVPIATTARLAWSPTESFAGIAVPTPVLVVNGAKPGPVLCLTAAVHGDELNGIEIVRRILYELDPQQLSGAIIGVPIVNLQGFRRNSRYLPDRRDLNRHFPGNPEGSSAARIAHSFFHEVILHCNALVDLHTGSFHRTNLPQVRADLANPGVAKLSQGFGATVVLKSGGDRGTLRRAAVEAGIPAVTLEAGEPMRLQESEVSHGVKSIRTLLGQMGMIKRASLWGTPEPIYYKSRWVRSGNGGILLSQATLGKRVVKGEVLGTVTDPITNARTEIASPYTGRVIGMALNQVVMPGFAAYHIGIQATEEQIRQPDPAAEGAPADDGADDADDRLPESQPTSEERAEGIEDS